jgi:predicted RNA-binding Zn-ribbon protein involved in translation (DUF1610 family)
VARGKLRLVRMKTRHYLCPVCGEPPYKVTFDEAELAKFGGEIPKELPCPECGAMMSLLPPKVANHFRPSRGNK